MAFFTFETAGRTHGSGLSLSELIRAGKAGRPPLPAAESVFADDLKKGRRFHQEVARFGGKFERFLAHIGFSSQKPEPKERNVPEKTEEPLPIPYRFRGTIFTSTAFGSPRAEAEQGTIIDGSGEIVHSVAPIGAPLKDEAGLELVEFEDVMRAVRERGDNDFNSGRIERTVSDAAQKISEKRFSRNLFPLGLTTAAALMVGYLILQSEPGKTHDAFSTTPGTSLVGGVNTATPVRFTSPGSRVTPHGVVSERPRPLMTGRHFSESTQPELVRFDTRVSGETAVIGGVQYLATDRGIYNQKTGLLERFFAPGETRASWVAQAREGA